MFKFMYSSIFSQHILIEHLLCAKYHSEFQRFGDKREKSLFSEGIFFIKIDINTS